ncbi:MAG: ABC-F family ATP-binding cassette domain-containing protein [Phycisphaerales bacterium]|nr:ABC-F family ATP-binding cassette domain-containing protein [Phycisphaerales bacterium]
MPLLALTNVTYSIGIRRVLDGVTFSVEPGERVGLVGRNGAGKSTLLRLIAGEFAAESGEAIVQRGARVGYLAQDPKFDAAMTLFDVAESAFAELHAAHEQMHELAHRMGETSGDELERIMKRYERLEAEMDRLGGYAVEHRIKETLHGLGFVDEQFELPVSALSGGQRSRVALARLLLENPDLLLLDEPTNHLDIDGRQWLENFLAEQFKGTVILVSHDRYLLDRVVHRIIELEPGRVSTYPGNYAKFRELRAERKVVEQRVYEKQQDRIRSEQKFIDRYRAGQRARQAQGRLSRLERYIDNETIDRPMEMNVMRLNLPKAPRTGDIVFSADGLSKAYDGRTLFHDLEISIGRGERIGIIGPNGSGKSTLAKCLIGEMNPDGGKVRIGSNVSIGHFSQLHEGLDLDLTVWEYLQSVILSIDGGRRASEQQARDLAGAFLFSGDDQDKVLRVLSGGERSRVILAGLVAGGHNVLVLDEPTNHFDIPSSERLEAALNPETGFDGTMLLISHDRALLDACVDRIIALDGQGQVRQMAGNYTAWKELRQRENAAAAQAKAQAAERKREQPPAPVVKSKNVNKAPASSGSLTKMSMSKLEARIEEIENRIRAIDESLMDVRVHTDGRKTKKLSDERASLAAELEPLEFEWSRRADGAE